MNTSALPPPASLREAAGSTVSPIRHGTIFDRGSEIRFWGSHDKVLPAGNGS